MTIHALRTTKIEIDTTKSSQENWIRASIQQVEVNPETLLVESESVTLHTVFRPVSKVALQRIDFISPITGQSHNLAIADIAEAIKVAMIGWMLADIPCHYDPSTQLVILNGDVE